MAREMGDSMPDWEKLTWENTPYPGVFLSKLAEECDPANPNVPLFSVFALRVGPGYSVPRHIHKRELEWREKIVLPQGGNFEILRVDGSERILNTPLDVIVKPYEVFGLTNHGLRPFFFTSNMRPGFTGYGEIEEIKQSADSQALIP
jgi:hypothetical protein